MRLVVNDHCKNSNVLKATRVEVNNISEKVKHSPAVFNNTRADVNNTRAEVNNIRAEVTNTRAKVTNTHAKEKTSRAEVKVTSQRSSSDVDVKVSVCTSV